jgi:hypothetical protein
MKKVLCRSLVLALGLALVASAASAKRGGGYADSQRESLTNGVNVSPMDKTLNAQFAGAALTTTTLYTQTFDVGATCSEAGWTKVDGTSQIAVFWHVDDFAGANVNAGDSLAVLAGGKSLWCGARFATTGLTCGYLVLPGYGNNWNQSWRTKTCVALTGNLDVSFMLETDSEPGYDATFLEYTNDCTGPDYTGWTTIDGGTGIWDDIQGPMAAGGSYAVGAGPVKVRIRFAADGGFSDEDANYDSHAGPSVVDNLVAEGLPVEDFEGEALNATTSNDWEGFGEIGYGQHMALFSGIALVQQDVCAKNLSCQWAAIASSAETYACGGFPLQTAVPKGNGEGQYLNNEVWSPSFAITGTGSVINLQFTVYRDMQLDGLVFYIWDVRSINAVGCQSAWRSRGFVYFGGQKDYLVNTFPVGDLIPASALSMRVRLGVIDQCGVWCGSVGTGACHSHAPLLDKVRVYRVDIFGPVYSTRDIDMFQDTFPLDGSDTGIGRADAALSITASASPTILPGDSSRIIVSDPITAVVGSNPSGLATDVLGGIGNQPGGTNGDKACYIWVHVNDNGVPAPAGKSGAALTDDAHYPFKDTQVADGKTWTRIQCWLRVASTSTFVVDLNDNLFDADDVISFFFAATNTSAQTAYASGSALNFVQSDLTVAAQNASEFTILPLNGDGTEGNDILYVDGMDGRGAQGFFDEAFGDMVLNPDRYDVRGPSSSVSNRPSTHVTDVATQLNGNYQKIIWDAGDLPQALGDGTGAPEKSNDYAMVNAFLGGLGTPGGVYICGDDYLAGLNTAAGGSAVTFKSTYITYTLTTGNHRPTYGIAPAGIGVAGQAFNGDKWIIFGGCPLINDFDVAMPTGGTVGQTLYDNVLTPPTVPSPITGDAEGYAEISKATGNAKVMISGYSFIYIRDDETDGTRDGSRHLRDILVYLANNPPQPTDAKPLAVNRLEQNYPNPFNPQTTIAFALKDRARVKIDVYNVSGELVKTLLDETRDAGAYSNVTWNGTNNANQPVSSGVYFYKLVTNNFSQTKKMVLLK